MKKRFWFKWKHTPKGMEGSMFDWAFINRYRTRRAFIAGIADAEKKGYEIIEVCTPEEG